MNVQDWCKVMAGLDVLEEDEAMAAYADWLEEQGLPALAKAARRLPSLVGLVSDEMESYVTCTYVDFGSSRNERSPGGWLYAWRITYSTTTAPAQNSWSEHLACGLVAAAAWHYPTANPTIAALTYVERMLPLDCASVFGTDSQGDVRARFARREEDAR